MSARLANGRRCGPRPAAAIVVAHTAARRCNQWAPGPWTPRGRGRGASGRQANARFLRVLPVADIKPLVDFVQGQLGCTVKVETASIRFPLADKPSTPSISGIGRSSPIRHRNWKKLPPIRKLCSATFPRRYDLAIRASIRELPEEYRQQLPSWFCPDEMDDLLLGWNVELPDKNQLRRSRTPRARPAPSLPSISRKSGPARATLPDWQCPTPPSPQLQPAR